MLTRACARLLAVLLACLATGALAQAVPAPPPALLLDARHPELALAGQLEMLVDPQRLADPALLPATGWTRLAGPPTIGYSRSAVWLRLRVEQLGAQAQPWRLSVLSALIDDVRVWSPDAEGRLVEQRSGPAVERHLWPVQGRQPTFIVAPPPGVHTLYLRLEGRYYSLSTRVRLWNAEAFRLQSTREALAYGAYFGVFIVVGILQLFFWLLLRERQAGWYVLYTLLLLLGQSLGAGYLLQWLNPPSWAVAELVSLYLCVAPAAVGRLTAVWLNLRQELPRLGRWYEGAIYTVAIVSSLLVLQGQTMAGAQLSQIATVAGVLLSLGLASWMWRRGLPNAGLYLLVFGFIDFGILTRFLRNLGVLSAGFVTDYAVFIGIALHLTAMSLYLIYRYSTLQQSLALEREARAEQREFVNMVSHEFRTPLAIINTSIQQLAANLDAPAEKSQQRAQNIRQAVQRMNLLLDDYLSLDRFDSVSQAVRPAPCDFYEVIEDAASDWPLGQVQIAVHELPPRFVCDADLLRIVLRNLLANAVRHSPPGAPIELDARGTGDGGLLLRVRDRGDGIPEDELPRLFQKYFRGRSAQGKPGAGLGLYLVRRIVEGHGGTIAVRSTAGSGSVFTITLPAGPAQSVNTVSTPV